MVCILCFRLRVLQVFYGVIRQRVAEAAELMKMTARDLLQNEVIDKMFLEPKEGLENNLEYTADALKEALCETIPKLQKKDIDELLEERYNRFRKFGEFIE